MRFRLTLRRLSTPCNIPINYQSYISANIYRLLELADAQYAAFLHDKGYEGEGKRFKYFTFGQLKIPRGKWQMRESRMLINAPVVHLETSFLVDKTVEKFVAGVFQDQHLYINDAFAHNDFLIEQIEMLPTVAFGEMMRFSCQSPLIITRKNKHNKHCTYLAPGDALYHEIFIENLRSKHQTYLSQQLPHNGSNTQIPPQLEVLNNGKMSSKLITLKPWLKQGIKVKGCLFDFELTAPPEMLKVGFYGGFGSNCAQGFGMVEVI
ncbi:CRISPR-associated endoribonuclease Cas6 [Microscilla marina]|uniref:CRISPR-associated endoribonuclease n=1 Tax=Microscilla marina ATCC 23134 TaxID=313606 RepID=A1ZVQ2_MICM2|nr:CRISPR-associated endoribonuclease Cas6 [Microscilla marina]EAY25595.1 crispr-associated protein Cas6 [Microscilla marina ATCC 23134]